MILLWGVNWIGVNDVDDEFCSVDLCWVDYGMGLINENSFVSV